MNYRRIYADGYSYFLTMVTHGREPLLVENIDLLRYAFALSKKKYDYRIDAIVVLPDHLHMIITPKISIEYSKIISHIKRIRLKDHLNTERKYKLDPTQIEAVECALAQLQRFASGRQRSFCLNWSC
ncbi:MAG TPA: hypothetical protein EYP79_03210 [Campylobacterales bacterium]|nr:hypothetical protein [Campylobacterales bacterium]